MAIRKLPRWLVVTLIVWVVVEAVHQLYLRAVYVKDGDYDWERYAVERNIDDLRLIRNSLPLHTKVNFFYERNPDQESLAGLPDSLARSIEHLRKDLTSGIDLLGERQNFSIICNRSGDLYEICIEAGAVFRQGRNGYNFSLVVTNKGNPSGQYAHYEAVGDTGFYIKRDINREYRWLPTILCYNCNSYDLLLTRLWRWMM